MKCSYEPSSYSICMSANLSRACVKRVFLGNREYIFVAHWDNRQIYTIYTMYRTTRTDRGAESFCAFHTCNVFISLSLYNLFIHVKTFPSPNVCRSEHHSGAHACYYIFGEIFFSRRLSGHIMIIHRSCRQSTLISTKKYFYFDTFRYSSESLPQMLQVSSQPHS